MFLPRFWAVKSRHQGKRLEDARLAAGDYALAHTLFPNSRRIFVGLMGNLLPVGERLFAANEFGHPASLAPHLSRRYRRKSASRLPARSPYRTDTPGEVERLNAINRANMERLMRSPAPDVPQDHQRR